MACPICGSDSHIEMFKQWYEALPMELVKKEDPDFLVLWFFIETHLASQIKGKAKKEGDY